MKALVLFLFFSFSLAAQTTTEPFESSKLGGTRMLTIGLPASYEKSPSKRYPILILLDGEYLFDPFSGALSYGAYWDDLPETIIVGIHQNKNDERVDDSNYDEVEGTPSGTGAKFFEFIGGELMPYLEKKYRVAPFRIIAGHDTTAGFLNFFLYKDNPLFNAYISLSPELAPNMEDRIPAKLASLKQYVFYYQSTSDGDVKQLQEPIKKLDANIKMVTNPQLNYKFDYLKGASHYSLVLYSIPNALYQIFESYKPISSTEYAEKIAPLSSGYVEYLSAKYDLLYKQLQLNIPVRINDFKAIEAAILKNKAYGELEKLAAISRKNYPKSMLSDYEMALMYEKTGDAKKAAKLYQKASQMEAIGNLTKDMMYQKFDDMQSLTTNK